MTRNWICLDLEPYMKVAQIDTQKQFDLYIFVLLTPIQKPPHILKVIFGESLNEGMFILFSRLLDVLVKF